MNRIDRIGRRTLIAAGFILLAAFVVWLCR